MSFFEKNLAIMTEEEQRVLAEKKVLVAGCGGLGGSVIELLCRSGFMDLTVADGDAFEDSNMNRQILCTTETLGRNKARAAVERARTISPEIKIEAVEGFLTPKNIRELVRGKDLVMDALDSAAARLLLEEACEKENVYLIHGAVNSWMLQTAVCPPGAGILHKLYGGVTGEEKGSGGTGVGVFACASFEVTEALKLLAGREEVLMGKVMFFDLLSKECQVVEL